jgi:hypothetical protein
MAEETFEKTDAGSSLTYPMQASSIRKNGFAILKGFPCKVVDMSTSKTGKHGHAKVNMTGVDIFTGKKYEELFGSTHNVEVPNVERADYQVCIESSLLLINFCNDFMRMIGCCIENFLKNTFSGFLNLVCFILSPIA